VGVCIRVEKRTSDQAPTTRAHKRGEHDAVPYPCSPLLASLCHPCPFPPQSSLRSRAGHDSRLLFLAILPLRLCAIRMQNDVDGRSCSFHHSSLISEQRDPELTQRRPGLPRLRPPPSSSSSSALTLVLPPRLSRQIDGCARVSDPLRRTLGRSSRGRRGAARTCRGVDPNSLISSSSHPHALPRASVPASAWT
jgi:hypothetical protein